MSLSKLETTEMKRKKEAELELEAEMLREYNRAKARGGKYIILDMEQHLKMKHYSQARMVELAQFLAESASAKKDIDQLVSRDSKLPKTMRRESILKRADTVIKGRKSMNLS